MTQPCDPVRTPSAPRQTKKRRLSPLQNRWGMVGKEGQAGIHDEGDDEFLDYDPEPYERELRIAWAGYRFVKPAPEETDYAFNRLHEVMKRWDNLVADEPTGSA